MHRQVTIRLLLEAVAQNGGHILNTPVRGCFTVLETKTHPYTLSTDSHTQWRAVSDKLGQIDPVRVQSVSPEAMCEVDSVCMCVYVCGIQRACSFIVPP